MNRHIQNLFGLIRLTGARSITSGAAKIFSSFTFNSRFTSSSLRSRAFGLRRHASVSLMAAIFVGSSVITNMQVQNTNLSLFLPPAPDVYAYVVNEASQYTPTLKENPSVVSQAIVDLVESPVIQGLALLPEDEENSILGGQAFVYTVEKGDSWDKIAKKFNLKTPSLFIANGHDSESIRKNPKILDLKVGSTLSVPFYNINGGPDDWVQISNEIASAKEAKRAAEVARNNRAATPSFRNRGKSILASLGRDMTSYGGFSPGWCTTGVAKFRKDIRSPFGNAKQWVNTARSRGMATGMKPAVGAVVATRENGYYGHVAYVTSVNGDTITVTEMNYEAFGKFSTRTFNPKASGVLIGYIY